MQIKLVYSESYTKPLKPPTPGSVRTPRWKGDRTDFVNGKLYGPEDVYITDGHNINEPFWVRTFRFIRLKISCRNQPLTLHHFQIRETYYPLSICTQINDSHEMETM